MLPLIRANYSKDFKLIHFPLLCLFSIVMMILYFRHQNDGVNLSSRHLNIKFKEKYQILSCTADESIRHGNLFKSFHPSWSSCYADIYLLAFDHHVKPVENLFDVGANKAYAVAAWLHHFLPELNINPDRLGQYLTTVSQITYPCGSCDDCRDPPMETRRNQSVKLQIHAFEPQPGTVTVLQGIQQWMNISPTYPSITLEFHGMAVSDRTGQSLFKKCNPGNEVCSLDVSSASAGEQVSVNITTLDDFANQYHLDVIDILKIDTEGFDPFVFRGARRLLSEHRIRLFVFEHLKTEGAWRNSSLEKETNILFDLGYICYMIGKTGLIRISSCWNDQFRTQHNNVLCVSSHDQRLLFNIDQLRLNGTVPIQNEKSR